MRKIVIFIVLTVFLLLFCSCGDDQASEPFYSIENKSESASTYGDIQWIMVTVVPPFSETDLLKILNRFSSISLYDQIHILFFVPNAPRLSGYDGLEYPNVLSVVSIPDPNYAVAEFVWKQGESILDTDDVVDRIK